MLLGDILDWSLESSCSGYEGDQEEESEMEKDSDSKYEVISGKTTDSFALGLTENLKSESYGKY